MYGFLSSSVLGRPSFLPYIGLLDRNAVGIRYGTYAPDECEYVSLMRNFNVLWCACFCRCYETRVRN